VERRLYLPHARPLIFRHVWAARLTPSIPTSLLAGGEFGREIGRLQASKCQSGFAIASSSSFSTLHPPPTTTSCYSHRRTSSRTFISTFWSDDFWAGLENLKGFWDLLRNELYISNLHAGFLARVRSIQGVESINLAFHVGFLRGKDKLKSKIRTCLVCRRTFRFWTSISGQRLAHTVDFRASS